MGSVEVGRGVVILLGRIEWGKLLRRVISDGVMRREDKEDYWG